MGWSSVGWGGLVLGGWSNVGWGGLVWGGVE